MRIVLNGERLLVENPAGPENYTLNLINALAKINQENDYIIYFRDNPGDTFFSQLTGNNPKFRAKVIKKSVSWTQFDLAHELFKSPPDVYFTAVHTMPVFHPKKTKIAAMIHGIEYEYNDKNATPVWYTAKNADLLIVPSEATKNKLLQRNWGISDNKINVVSEGVNADFYKRSKEECKNISNKYDLKLPYFIFISTIQPRKNLTRLIEAFSMLQRDVQLVVCGKNGWNYEESLNAPKKFNIQEKVKFLGRVPDEDLPALISNSLGYISVSLEEGFGLPLLEAMACEVPCLVSDIPAYKELGKDYVLYTDPNNVSDIKTAIETLFSAQLPDKLKLTSDYAKSFTWEKCARETLKLILTLH